MSGKDFFTRIFEQASSEAQRLLLIEPDSLPGGADSPEVAAWQLLRGTMVLRRAGQSSPANDWLNHAAKCGVNDDVYRAELLGEAAEGLHGSGRLEDAFKTADSALAIWRDVCAEAITARSAGGTTAGVFAERLKPMFVAAGLQPPANGSALLDLWLNERAVVARSAAGSLFIRLLSRNDQSDAARPLANAEIEWMLQNFTSPYTPVPASPLKDRIRAEGVRRAIYQLLLARGEVELAANAFGASADAFNEAAKVYEGHTVDYADINRLLRAKFNQANSLLRLDRLDEAMKIYELCEHGFHSVGGAAEVERVKQAMLFVRSRKADALDDDD